MIFGMRWRAIVLSGLWFATPPAWADPNSTTQAPATEVAPTLLEQVALTWPEDAAPDAHGTVRIRVQVNAKGTVTYIELVDGPEVFHASANAAGQALRFAPAQRDGIAVPGSAVVIFHFAPPDHLVETDDYIEVVVHGRDPSMSTSKAQTTLEESALDRAAGTDLAATVSTVPGVTFAQGTTTTSKPIIRGQQERRLLVLYDGIRHQSQKWGPDHATEIDPFAAGEITVIRGPSGARYGPDAMGGVILVEPPSMRFDAGVSGKTLVRFSSNGLAPYAALRLDWVPASVDALSLRVEGNVTRSANLTAPDYALGNTASETWNLGATLRYRWNTGAVKLSWHHYDLRAGVFYGIQHSTPAEFEAQLALERPITADLWSSTTYAIDRPYQDVTHDLVALNHNSDGDWGNIETTYAFQINQRKEFEAARESVTGAQYDFTLRTHSLDTRYEHPSTSAGLADFNGGLGIQGTFQENIYQGLPLLPNYRAFEAGVYAFERITFRRGDVELGARYDHLARTGFLSKQDFDNHERRGTLDDTVCEDLAQSHRCPRTYRGASFSIGSLTHLIPEHVDFMIDVSSASRFPNVDELYLIGSAPSFPVYAVGSPNLGTETSWGASATLGVRLPWLEGEVSGFGNYVHQYIDFSPEFTTNGDLAYDVTIQGTWPRYAYRALDAAVYGADAAIHLAPEAVVGFNLRGALVRAHAIETGEHLNGIPPDRLHLELLGRLPPLGQLQDIEIRCSTDLVARQSRVAPEADFAPAPAGYVLFHLHADATVALRGQTVRWGLDAINLANTPYRDYNSLLRYYADQAGINIRLRVGIDF